MRLNVTLLGTGTSHGVPMIGCECSVCRSQDVRDRRTRPSILIEIVEPESDDDREFAERTAPRGADGSAPARSSTFARAVQNVLVDTSTDLRLQALTLGIRRIDAILFTHSHADHIMGLDEMRRFNVMQRTAIPCFADARTLADLRRTFVYIFDQRPATGGGIPQLSLCRIGGPFTLGGVEIIPVPILHGRQPILGFRLGRFAYLTDCSAIPDQSWPLLSGVDTLVLDALRDKPHPTHFSVAEALQVVERIGPRRAYFTHICHDLPHAATNARLPAGVELAYDGLVLEMA